MRIGIKNTILPFKRPRSGSTPPPPPTNLVLLENGVNFILLEGSATDKIELE